MTGSNQHFVPQFLLRAFGHGKKKSRRIFVLDKHDGSVSERLIKDVASAPGFYDTRQQDRSLDPLIGELENAAGSVIRLVRKHNSVRILNRTERRLLAFFTSVQMLRTLAQREDLRRMNRVSKKVLSSMGAASELLDSFGNDDTSRDEYIDLIADVAPTLIDHLLDKAWLLYRPTTNDTFYISDNPVTRANVFEPAPFRSNLGLSCPGIQIHLPLKPDLMLTMICQDVMLNLIVNIPSYGVHIQTGRPLLLRAKNTEYYNSLQVINAERFVFSARADFALGHEMLDEHPSLRNGPRTLVIHPAGDRYPEADFERAARRSGSSRRVRRGRTTVNCSPDGTDQTPNPEP